MRLPHYFQSYPKFNCNTWSYTRKQFLNNIWWSHHTTVDSLPTSILFLGLWWAVPIVLPPLREDNPDIWATLVDTTNTVYYFCTMAACFHSWYSVISSHILSIGCLCGKLVTSANPKSIHCQLSSITCPSLKHFPKPYLISLLERKSFLLSWSHINLLLCIFMSKATSKFIFIPESSSPFLLIPSSSHSWKGNIYDSPVSENIIKYLTVAWKTFSNLG